MKTKTLVTEASLRAAYQLLRETAFKGINLPSVNKVTFRVARLKKYHALYEWPAHIMIVNSTTESLSDMLKIVAHEMIPAALEQNADCDHDHHDDNFIELANQICKDLKWDGGVL